MKKIRVGIFGTGNRGQSMIKPLLRLDAEIVAICDISKDYLDAAMKMLDKSVKVYDNFDDFIEHPMDAVLLMNNFYEHAPYAIKCFERNIHVYSECISNGTMAEGVELVRAFEKSKSIYMLAENYPQMQFNLEMKRIADAGTLGKIVYAEGEYNHPVAPQDAEFDKICRPFPKHWRNFCPATYYVTHSLGPVMRITGATPKKVTAFAMYAPREGDVPASSYVADNSANITTLNDDGSVFRFTGCAHFGARHNAYRICGTKGQVENPRGMEGRVYLRYNRWDIPEGGDIDKLYWPVWSDEEEALVRGMPGHGGSDILTLHMFMDSIKQEKQPPHPFDIYSATTMSSVAILGHRSVLDGGKVYDLPDFRKEEDRKLYENDDLTPFWGSDGSAPTLPCCSHPEYKPTQRQLELYLKHLEE